MTAPPADRIRPSIAQRSLATAALLALYASVAAGQQRPFVERVDVSRVLIDARVLDDSGHAVAGLGPRDFHVRIDGDPVRVESVEWVGSGAGESADAVADGPGESAAQSDGRLIVVLVQKDLEPVRIVGLMVMLRLIEPFLQQLRPADRVAVLSFDSRLRLWTDFTGDVDRLRSLLTEEVLLHRPPPVTAADGPSLVARLDLASTKRAGGFEHSLHMIAEALEPLPGAKSVVLLGYGFGRFNARTLGVTLMDGYDEARVALQQARASVFSLNVTQADFNSMQMGLQSVSAATGGLYSGTYQFPARAMARVIHALRGYYVLFVEKPGGRTGEHRIEVRLSDRAGTVFARSSYVD